MIARLLLVLMLVMAAVPGMAAGASCHEPSASPMAMMPAMAAMPAHHDHGAPAEHRCLGCVPVPEPLAARPAPRLARAPLPRPMPVRFAVRGAAPPAAPPPRIG